MTRTISALEVAWLTGMLLAAGWASLSLLDAVGEWLVERKKSNRPVAVVLTAKMYVYVLGLITFICTVFVAVGWRSAITPQGEADVIDFYSFLLLLAALAIGWVVLVIRRFRYRIRTEGARSVERKEP